MIQKKTRTKVPLFGNDDQCAFWEHESALFGIKLYPLMSLVGS